MSINRTRNNEQKQLSVYNIDEKQFDFKNARATNLPFNIRTHLPGRLSNAEEIPIQNLKIGLMDICDKYINTHKTKNENLSQQQKHGLKSLHKDTRTMNW